MDPGAEERDMHDYGYGQKGETLELKAIYEKHVSYFIQGLELRRRSVVISRAFGLTDHLNKYDWGLQTEDWKKKTAKGRNEEKKRIELTFAETSGTVSRDKENNGQ